MAREIELSECNFTKPDDGPAEKAYLAQMKKRMAPVHREIRERAKEAGNG